MFYRQSGIRHTRYEQDRRLWRLPFDRKLVALVCALAVAAPFLLSDLYVGTYLMPWLLWTTAALGLNLLMGTAGQVHLGYGAVMAIGAYGSLHAARAGVPFEFSILIGGLLAASIGTLFGAAALRVKGLYLAVSTLAMQYIVDYTIVHVPAISGGSQATLQAPPVRLLGMALAGDAAYYWFVLAVCALVTLFILNVRRSSYGAR